MSEQSSCRGISFPFRLGNKGGVVMSEVTKVNPSHLNESIAQILLTGKGERTMEQHMGSVLDVAIFEPDEIATHNLIKYQIVEALKQHEPRITIDSESITLYSDNEGKVYANLTYTINEYNSTFTFTTNIGGVDNEI